MTPTYIHDIWPVSSFESVLSSNAFIGKSNGRAFEDINLKAVEKLNTKEKPPQKMFHWESISSIVNARALKMQPEHMTLSTQWGYKGSSYHQRV